MDAEKMRDILAKIQEKTAAAKALVADDQPKAAEIMDEVDKMRAEYDVLKRIDDADRAQALSGSASAAPDVPADGGEGVAEFAKAAREGFRRQSKAAQTEGLEADGGYAVPQDIQTRINERRDAEFSLRSLVTVVPTRYMKGAATFLKRSVKSGFKKVAEAGKIEQTDAMSFERVEYSIEKYAGYMPVTSELLSDADATLAAKISDWFGDEHRATDNALILEALGAFATDLKDLSGLKKAVNVTLGQAFAPTSHVVTNDDGLNWLDTLQDGFGRWLLAPDPANPMQATISIGMRRIPLDVVPNEVLATTDSKIPVIAGDLKEGVALFDRQSLSIKSSDVAAVTGFNAFEQDMVLYRGILREDVEVIDSKAYVMGYVSPDAAATPAAAKKS